MACDSRTQTIRVEPAEVSFGKKEVSCITGALALTGGESFLIASPREKYQVWIDIDGGSVAPTPGNGEVLVELDLTSGYSIADLNAELILKLEALSKDSFPEFYVTESTDGLSVSVEAVYVGAALAALADVDSGFTVHVDDAGFGGALGKTKEAIEVSFESTTIDVTSNQTGSLLLDQFVDSTNASLSMALLELTKERFAAILGNGFGDTFTPSGGSELIGFGTSKQFQSLFALGGQLILHPVALPDSDKSRDVVFWRTNAVPESINYDGTDTQALSVSFNALPVEQINSAVSVYSIGDWTQDVRA